MRTRSSSFNDLLSPLPDPERLGSPPAGPNPQGPPPGGSLPQMSAPGLGTMEELCQPSMNGQGEPIAPLTI
ncbi:hypothetical protein Tco_0289231 [Tanacetum coccineum]